MNESDIIDYIITTTPTPTLDDILAHVVPDEHYPELAKRCATMGIATAAEFRKALAGAQQRARVRAELGVVPRTTREFVEALLAMRSFTIDATVTNSLSWVCPEHHSRRSFASDVLLRHASDLNRNLLQNQFRTADLAGEVEQQTVRIKLTLATDIKSRLQQPGSFDWHGLIRRCFDVGVVRWEVQAAALQKLIWQVKRRLDDMPVTNHLMPVIFGKQGSGKTEFLTRMLAVLGPLWQKGDFARITDDREADLFKHYVVFLDEMQKATVAEMGAIKDVITRSHGSHRVLYTHSTATFDQNASFVGATNKMLGQVITDTTGSRRFFQLYFKPTCGQAEWDYIDALDFAAMWQSVDHRAADPSEPYLDEMVAIREETKSGSTVDQFIEHLIENDGHYHAGRERERLSIPEGPMQNQVVFWAYHDYCRAMEITKPFEQNNFLAELRRLASMDDDFPLVQKRTNRFNGWQYRGPRSNVLSGAFRGRTA